MKAERSPLLSYSSQLLKLEYKQAGSSYKMRGLISLLDSFQNKIPESIAVLSAGNMARSLLILASQKSKIKVYVPDSIPSVKENALKAFPCELIKIPMPLLWKMVEDGVSQWNSEEYLVHPIDRPEVLAGYASIADEILEEAPDTKEVYIPFGVGGLFLGVAKRIKELHSEIKVIAVESKYKHPLHSALTKIKDPQQSSWVDAIGTPYVLKRVLDRLQSEKLLDGVSLVDPEIAKKEAIHFYQNSGDKIEGAAALTLSACLKSKNKAVAILSGSNVNPEIYQFIK